ncbi:MAG: hypothetical protein HYY24_25720 [Verrucomicrobia bacterium]|nr:hypothetical protein [Verrucomicrobiota bacterium]
MPDQTPEDERVARRWLQEANMRPVVRIRYDAADILQLIEQRRGLLVVSGGDATNRRELYLATSENKAPLFEKLTPSVASRFSSYSLALNASPAFATFAGPLPAYFPTGEVELSFVPENELATIVFSSVAAASRALPKEFVASNRVVFEGQLRLNGVQPVFELLEARVGTNRHVFSRAQTAEVR